MTLMLSKTESSDLSPDTGLGKRISLEQRLLAEAVRLHEEARGEALDEPQADAAARQAGGDFERRIIARAQSLSIAPALKQALQQLNSAVALVMAVGLVMAMIAGATTARVALGAAVNGPVNFFAILGSILGVHIIALVAWLISMLLRPGTMLTGSLGGVAFTLGRRVTQWLHKGPLQLAAVQAVGAVYARSAIGRWTLSAISHALWLAFLVGALLSVVVILSIKQYTFAWETTILSEQIYIMLTRTLALLPEALGFPTPDAQQIADSRWPGRDHFPAGAREAWSGLLVGSIMVYGLLPRAVLLVLCLIARWQAGARFRLDITRPGYSHLQTRLLPISKSLGVVDRDEGLPAGRVVEPVEEGPLPIRAEGPTAIMGLEIDPPKSDWPLQLKGVEWIDLGFIDSRAERRQALERIRSSPTPPRLIVVVCSLATTPDRGIRAFISDLQHQSRTPVVIVLTEGQRLRARGHPNHVEQRVEDWRQLAEIAHVPGERVVEVDLDHFTEASRARLARLVGTQEKATPPGRRIEQSFQVILDHVRRWSGEPGASEQAELHRAIAALYRGEGQAWQALLKTKVGEGVNQTEQLKTSAERMVSLLPERLRQNSRWLAVGALTGAMGCVAAATLVAPVAIAALPAWAGLGAAVSAAVQATRSHRSPAATPPSIDLSEAVSSAALFALVLELQGRDETTITRIIDRVAVEDEPPVIDSAEAARNWLDALRQRLDQALAAEGSS